MIAAQEEKVLRVLDLVGQQKTDGLQRLLATIDVVAQKEVIRFGWEATVLKEPQQVGILSVDVTCVREEAKKMSKLVTKSIQKRILLNRPSAISNISFSHKKTYRKSSTVLQVRAKLADSERFRAI